MLQGVGVRLRHRKFVDLAVETEAADKHMFGNSHIDHVDDKLAGAANIGHRVLILAIQTRLDSENNDGRIMGEDVEKAHRRCIVVARLRAGRNKRYRPWTNKIRQQPIAALRLKRGEVEFHDVALFIVYNIVSYC